MLDRSHHSRPQRLGQESTAALHEAVAIDDPVARDARLREAQGLAGDSALADAYTYLQKAVGLIAVTLPLIVAVGHLLSGGHGLQGSISAYYHTHLGNYFVGSLCALGVFFLSYNYRPLPEYKLDNYLSNLACAAAVGVALFPTASDALDVSGAERAVSALHLVFACVLFVLLAVFSLFLFTKTDGQHVVTSEKRRRNLVYRSCGWVIVAAIVLVLVAQIVDPPNSWHSLFWLESVAVVAFGVSWLVKGEFFGLLADA